MTADQKACRSGRAAVSAQSPAVPQPPSGQWRWSRGGPARWALHVGVSQPILTPVLSRASLRETMGAGLSGKYGPPHLLWQGGLRLSPGSLPCDSAHTEQACGPSPGVVHPGSGRSDPCTGAWMLGFSRDSRLPRPCRRDQVLRPQAWPLRPGRLGYPVRRGSAPAAFTHSLQLLRCAHTVFSVTRGPLLRRAHMSYSSCGGAHTSPRDVCGPLPAACTRMLQLLRRAHVRTAPAACTHAYSSWAACTHARYSSCGMHTRVTASCGVHTRGYSSCGACTHTRCLVIHGLLLYGVHHARCAAWRDRQPLR